MLRKLLLILTSISIGAQLCLASNEPIFTAYPSNTGNRNKWIVRDVNPGDKYEEYLTIKNLSDKKIHVQISSVETAGSETEIQILDNQPAQNIGKWINLEETSIEIGAYEKKQVKIVFAIPAETPLGEYQAAVFATHTNRTATNLNMTTRIGTRIYLNVTNNKILHSNVLALPINGAQLVLIIFSLLGIIISSFALKLENKHSLS